MRLIQAEKIGQNKLPDHFRLLVSGPSGCGKTTWIENLIFSNRISKPFTRIYYIYPSDFETPPVDWDQWDSHCVTFVNFIPDLKFFHRIEADSLVVFDDNFEEVANSPLISKVMRIHSRRRFSVILVCQMFFERAKYSRVIKNQLNGLVMFRNFIDVKINHNIARQLGVLKAFKKAEDYVSNTKYDPVVILSPEICLNTKFRVFTNYLSETSFTDSCSFQKCFIE